jgi:hypothetical protein
VLHLPGWLFRFGFSTLLAGLFGGIMLFGLAAGYLASVIRVNRPHE